MNRCWTSVSAVHSWPLASLIVTLVAGQGCSSTPTLTTAGGTGGDETGGAGGTTTGTTSSSTSAVGGGGSGGSGGGGSGGGGCGPAACDDGNPCTIDACEADVCSHRPAPEGAPCPNTYPCSIDALCTARGQCVAGTPKDVSDGDECTLDLCDPATGEVTHPIAPSCSAWEPTPTAGAPAARTHHTAVWTGTEMIVWGGQVDVAVDPSGVTSTGGRYDPVAKKWTATSTTNAPSPRHSHTAVWTGSKMIVWGGYGDKLESTGGIYDPATDTWAALPTVGAPQPRVEHTAVWSGVSMFVWGGLNQVALGTGARYTPATNAWLAMPQGPAARFNHGAVWTGVEMLMWGGNDYFDWHQDGRTFDPFSGWGVTTSLLNAPSPREGHTTLWTGWKMLVWGGFDGGVRLNTGAVLDLSPGAGATWSAMSLVGAPAGREKHVGLWTGSAMLVWGGCGKVGNVDSCVSPVPAFDDGGLWTPGPGGGTWAPLASGEVTTGRVNATAVWTGDRAIIWGGQAGVTGALLATGAQSAP